ncbi:MAG: AAA family ATPase, partial [Nakamurella sp.]
MSALTLELTDEFVHALSLLDAGRSLFLTGKAGSGKSTLIRHFLESTYRRVLVAAPTGIAALNVDGYTVHRLFGFYSGLTLDEVRSGHYYPRRFAETLKSLETLIIDEASMVRADLFDMLVAALERFGPQPGTLFGGVQIVLVGDLFQLPPVVQQAEAEYFSTRYETPYFFSADRFTRDEFPTVELTKVFRQLGDLRMTTILNAIREGALLTQAREQLNMRTDAYFEPPEDEFWLTLAPTNRIVTARNRRHLDRLDTQEHTHYAGQTGDLELFDPPVEKELHFKVGAQIMMLTNDASNRWVNGTIGRISEIYYDDTDIAVIVEFRDGAIVEVVPHLWEATRPIMREGRIHSELIGTYTQLPF